MSIAKDFLDYMKLDEGDFNYSTEGEFKSVFDVVEFLENANIREKEINAELLELESRNDLSLKVTKKMKKDYRKELVDLQRDIDGTLDLLTRFTTFDSRILLPFLVKYLSITERQNFCLMSDLVPFNDFSSEVLNIKPVRFKGTTYYIVTTDKNMEKLEWLRQPMESYSIKDIEGFISIITDDKYICMEKAKRINILDGSSLDEYFANFPNLKRLGYAIANLGLSHPEFSDEDILETILETVKKQNTIVR